MASTSEELKQRERAIWTAGDFGHIAKYGADAAARLIAELSGHFQPGARVLDVACGTGNLALPVARLGARVTGVDIAPNLLDQARTRAEAEGLAVTFDEGDAEKLPYSDDEFDVVMGLFGAMFASRPDKVASELPRVCKSGGTILMGNWMGSGFFGKMFALGRRYLPPPEGVPAPLLWGEESVVRERLGPFTSTLETAKRMFTFDYPFSPLAVAKLYERFFGPTVTAIAKLKASDRDEAYAREFEEIWLSSNEGSGDRTIVRVEYLEVVAKRL